MNSLFNPRPRSEYIGETAPADLFPLLTAAVEEEANRRTESKRFFIENGYCTTWAEEHRNEPDNGLKQYSTPKKWEAYQAGTLSREKAVEIAVKRACKDVEKWKEKQFEKLRTASCAPDLDGLQVSVEWKRNRTWGANPTATARTPDGIYNGYASGCGYDKESAAVAEALNQSASVRKVLYIAAEQALKAGDSFTRFNNGNVCWGDVLGYGSGYDILPYFEGGVGVSCFWSILKSCDFSTVIAGSGKMFDCYTVERKGA